MAQHAAPQKVDLGPGFWPVTIVLTVLNVIVSYVIVIFPFAKLFGFMGEPAGDIDWLFNFMSIVGNAIFVYVSGYLIYFSVVWRRKATDGPDAIGIQVHDSPKLELWWTIVPAILVAIIGVFSVRIWSNLQNAQGDVLTTEAIGHQFNYEFRYPKLKASVYDEFHLPVNVPVTLNVTSVDVLHSFWMPEMRIKADMVPGLVQTLRFTPQNIGTYRIVCTEFCGTNHANMAGKIVVQSKADFDAWLTKQASMPAGGAQVDVAMGNVAAGQKLFAQKCTACHQIAPFNQKIVGPGLGKLATDPDHPKLVTGDSVDAKGIAHILVNGYQGPDMSDGKSGPSLGVMPNQQANGLSGKDVADLATYVLSLSKK